MTASLTAAALVAASALALPDSEITGSQVQVGARVTAALVLLFLAELPVVTLRFGHSREHMGLYSTALVIGLVLLPAPWLVLVQVVTSTSASLALRRQPVKVAFNAASDVISVSVACGIASLATRTGQWPSGAGDWLVLAGAVLAASGASTITVGAAVAAAQSLRLREVLGRSLGFRIVTPLVNVALGLAVVLLARWSPMTLLVLPVVTGLLVYVHRGNLRAQEESDVWRQLEDAGQELRRLQEDEILPRAVARTAALMRCDWVELVLRRHGEDGWLTHRGGLRGLEGEPLVTEGPVVVPPLNGRPEPVVGPNGQTLVEVGLSGPDGPLGLLRVGFTGGVRVRERELQVLTTYARGMASTLLNARLYADAVAEAERKAWLAGHDILTGLVNRTGLLDLAPEVERTGERFAVLVLDMDHFKQVNDTLGHDSGDRLLQHAARVLAGRVRRGDVAARLEGDAFAVLLRHLDGGEDVEAIAEDILRVVADPVEHEEMRLSLEGTIGFAVGPTDGDTLELLLKRADMAMAQGKSSPGSSRRWRADRDEFSRDRLALSADLRSGLSAGNELVLHYQPQVDLVSGAVSTVEVLARWQHPTRGMLMPKEFVPVAERSGLARPFTLAVLDSAVRQAAEWRTAGLGAGAISIAVNLSARNLLDRELPSDVAAVLARHGLPARQLTLEITETVVMNELEVVSDVLARLRGLGVHLSVDDFGTGYSSLKFLQAVQVNEVKIDREFVMSMLDNDQDAAIVSATIELGHSLGLRVVAEGVERPEHLAALVLAGCDSAQGYHVARPMPADELGALLLPDDRSVVPLRPARRRTAGARGSAPSGS